MLAPSCRVLLTVGRCGGLVTASADKTIKLWRDGKCIHTYEGHSDAVRALQAIEGVGFLSGSNDG
jgi:phospholipase A-2-activating protein